MLLLELGKSNCYTMFKHEVMLTHLQSNYGLSIQVYQQG